MRCAHQSGNEMADPDDEELGDIEAAEPTEPEWYEVEGGYIIFPHGA